MIFRITFFFVLVLSTAFAQAQSPGGVSTNLVNWLKSNAGTSTTTDGVGLQTWTDQTSPNYNATQGTAGLRPLFRNNSSNVNFNPYIRFDGVDD